MTTATEQPMVLQRLLLRLQQLLRQLQRLLLRLQQLLRWSVQSSVYLCLYWRDWHCKSRRCSKERLGLDRLLKQGSRLKWSGSRQWLWLCGK